MHRTFKSTAFSSAATVAAADEEDTYTPRTITIYAEVFAFIINLL